MTGYLASLSIVIVVEGGGFPPGGYDHGSGYTVAGIRTKNKLINK